MNLIGVFLESVPLKFNWQFVDEVRLIFFLFTFINFATIVKDRNIQSTNKHIIFITRTDT